MNIKINDKDDIILKILHYFITEENYKPVIINGIENEIWLENMQSDLKLIRINTNYIHNEEQLKADIYKAQTIMKSIKEKSEEYGYTNWQSEEYHDGASEGLEFDPIGHTQKTFEAGANYVLEEIEKLTNNQNWCAFPKQSHKELKELIEQLRK